MRLDDVNHHSVYLSEGLGHGFVALSDQATFVYFCSEGYAPQREHGVNPFDPELDIEWPSDIEPILSDKDAEAPTLAAAREMKLLPTWRDCQDYYAELRRSSPAAP
ncbi:hypothetical protein GCM10029992_05710 [Glycomyces albus]